MSDPRLYAQVTLPSWGLAQAAAETAAWATRQHRFGVSFKEGHRVGFADGVGFAGPSWNTITPAQQLEHIETCPDMCALCEAGRAIGACVSCGDTKEALPPHGESRCCGSHVALNPEES